MGAWGVIGVAPRPGTGMREKGEGEGEEEEARAVGEPENAPGDRAKELRGRSSLEGEGEAAGEGARERSGPPWWFLSGGLLLAGGALGC